MNEAAPQILEAICRHLRFELGELWCLGKNETALKLKSVWHLPSARLDKFVAESRQLKFAVNEGLPGKVWAKNAPVWFESLDAENQTPRRFFAAEVGLYSAFAFPIAIGEKMLGVFSFFSAAVRQPDAALLQMFAAVGRNIGQFIKRESIEVRLESRLTLLAEISELMRAAENADELLFAVAQAVGEHLKVRRCLFNEINLATDTETIHRDYCRGVKSVAGAHRISDYSSVTSAEMTAGRTVVNNDSKIDARTRHDYDKIYELNGERAYLTVPLMRENRWVASLWVSDDVPREWEPPEISLLETIAERTWTAVEKIRINADLRASEERYRSLFETMDEGFCLCEMIFSADGKPFDYRFLEVNTVFEKMTGLKDAAGKTARELLPDLEPHWFEIYGEVVSTGKSLRFTDGSEVMNRWFDVYASRVGGTDSRNFSLLFNDISERVRAEIALKESQAHLALALKVGRAGTFEWDIKNNINRWSPEIEAMYGVPIGTFEGNFEGWKKRVVAEDAEMIEQGIQFALEEKSSDYEYEFRVVLPDGSQRWFAGRARFEYGTESEPLRMIGINLDITERKQAEFERERLFIKTEKARRIAEQANHAKDEFIALVSHELRSPLNAMLGWTRILQNQKPDEKTVSYALDVIVRNARSQSRLIEDLLDIARVGKGKLRVEMEPTELIPIINAAVEIIKPTVEAKNISFTQTLNRAADFITGDVDRLRQVVENLLANAVKFTPENGKIELRLERYDKDARIIIRDDGQGISPEFLPHIFERFRQADPSTTRRHGGLGIGLSLARDLVELHGGTISAQSAGENTGSTFTVTLPLRIITPINENSNKVETMDSQGKLSGFWILAVDDEADARELVSFMLQINGAKVTTANSAVEALELLKSSSGRLPDILLSDISMPNESGYALLEKIRALPEEHGGQIPAVALTAFNRPEDREAAFDAGFQKHLGKPVEPEDLISAIIETVGAR